MTIPPHVYRQAIEVLSRTIAPSRLTKMKSLLDQRSRSVTVVIENGHDMGNASACLRTLDSHGIQDVHLIEGYGMTGVQESKTMGCEKWMTIHRHQSTLDCVRHLKNKGYSLWSTDLTPGSVLINSNSFPRLRPPSQTTTEPLPFPTLPKIALAFGNESRGISKRLRSMSDGLFILPMTGFSQSYNLSVAVAITMTWLRTQESLRPDLTEEEKDEILCKWLVAGKNTKHILEKSGIPLDDF